MNKELAFDIANFVIQVGEDLDRLDRQLQRDVELQARCSALSKRAASRLAEVGLIARHEIPEWERDLATNPAQAIKTLYDVCDICEQLSKRAAETQKEKAVSRALNPGYPVFSGQNGHKQASYSSSTTDNLPGCVKVLLESASRLQ